MALSQSRRTQLDGIVEKMSQQNAPKEDVQLIVDDFVSKFGNEDTAPKSDSGSGGLQTKGSFLKNVGKALADTALQPARFLERGGKFIGTLGLSEGDRKKVDSFLGKGLQERVGGEGYATPTYTSGKQFAGGAAQAAANLATPFVRNPLGMAAQGAAFAGGKTLEDGGSVKDASLSSLIGGAGSFALGKGTQLLGGAIGQGVAGVQNQTKKILQPIAKKLAPLFTGVSKKELNIAFNDFPEITARNLKIIQDASTPQEAESTLRSALLKKSRETLDVAKARVGKKFETSLEALKQEFVDARGNVPDIAKSLKEKLPRFGQPVSADERMALDSVLRIVQEPREYTIDGMRVLYDDLWGIAQRTEQGSPARRAATAAISSVRNELRTMTNGKIDRVFAPYAKFKEAESELRPLWSESVSEDTARNFVANLASLNKTASNDALGLIERLSGKKNQILPEITLYKLAQKLSKDEKVTGSRNADILAAALAPTAFGSIGGLIGGDKGKSVGNTLGILTSARVLAPSVISKILLPEIKSAGIQTTGAFRQQLGKVINNKNTRQALLRLLQPRSEE